MEVSKKIKNKRRLNGHRSALLVPLEVLKDHTHPSKGTFFGGRAFGCREVDIWLREGVDKKCVNLNIFQNSSRTPATKKKTGEAIYLVLFLVPMKNRGTLKRGS